jgi:hypothetical protein
LKMIINTPILTFSPGMPAMFFLVIHRLCLQISIICDSKKKQHVT